MKLQVEGDRIIASSQYVMEIRTSIKRNLVYRVQKICDLTALELFPESHP